MMTYGLIIIGLIGLFFGGEALVRGSVAVARKLGMSELLIGLTLVGFGTSMPELVTTLQASSDGATGIAVGNVVGSNIANILLVLGIAAVLHPIVTNPKALARDTMVMVGVTAAFIAVIYLDLFTRTTGIAMVAFLLLYIVGSFVLDQRNKGSAVAELHGAEAEEVGAPSSLVVGLLMAVFGVAGVILGAKWLVTGAVTLARDAGIPETVVGLTIVAVGTSLPELVTSAIASLKGRSDVALGNVIGSNIFNLSGIIGVTAIVNPFSVMVAQPAAGSILDTRAEPQGMVELPIVSNEDIGALVLATFFLILFGLTGKKLSRWEGAVLLGGYALYTGMLFDLIPTPCWTWAGCVR